MGTYIASTNDFLSSVDGLATPWATIRAPKLLSQFGRIWVSCGAVFTLSVNQGDVYNY